MSQATRSQTETLKLIHYAWRPADSKPDRIVGVEYRPRDHWNTTEDLKAYDVLVDGELVGAVEQVIESTDRRYNRIRVPGKGRLAWAWRRPRTKADGVGWGEVRNAPGLYCPNRRKAVAEILGYTTATKEAA